MSASASSPSCVERAGAPVLELDLPDGARVADALAAVGELAAGLPLVMAVNREYADADAPLHAVRRAGPRAAGLGRQRGGDEPALHWRVTDEPLSLDALAARVRRSARRCGGDLQRHDARCRTYLDYEAYAEMADAELERIVRAVAAEHELCARRGRAPNRPRRRSARRR